MAWDIPAPPEYLAVKRAIFTNIVPGWERIFVEGDIDWRMVSWGGVLIDDRAYDQTDQLCNCIPAADNPEVSTAQDATWLDDDDIIFVAGSTAGTGCGSRPRGRRIWSARPIARWRR